MVISLGDFFTRNNVEFWMIEGRPNRASFKEAKEVIDTVRRFGERQERAKRNGAGGRGHGLKRILMLGKPMFFT